MTCIFGIARIRARSSIIWWEAPSSPSETPPCEAPIRTFSSLWAIPSADLVVGARGGEDREGRGVGDLAGGGQAAGDRHHVRLGGADVEEPLRELLAELHRLGRDGEVGVEGDDLVVGLAEGDQRVAVGLPGGDRLASSASAASIRSLAISRLPSSALVCCVVGRLELLQRLLGLLLARRLAVEAEAVLHEGDAAALLRLADDRGRPVEGAAALERLRRSRPCRGRRSRPRPSRRPRTWRGRRRCP